MSFKISSVILHILNWVGKVWLVGLLLYFAIPEIYKSWFNKEPYIPQQIIDSIKRLWIVSELIPFGCLMFTSGMIFALLWGIYDEDLFKK